MMPSQTLVALLIAGTATACSADAGDPLGDGPPLTVDVAALNLQGVGDVVWDLEVRNGAGTPETVWQRRVSSSGYGDGAGSASYVGTCDADANPNTVRVWVVGVYDAPVTTLGTFAAGADGGVVGTPLDFENPTALAPLEQTVTCAADRDVAVQFDVALMRPAQQGFFDIAVSFNDVFCSAKLDCCDDADDSGTCDAGEDIALLFRADSTRGRTLVLGFACTAGTQATDATALYLDAIDLDCTDPASGFAADLTLRPDGADAGNQCVAGAVSGCAVVDELGAVVADDYLYQVAVYRGDEDLVSDGLVAHKTYWNVALGVTAAIGDCELRTRATADNTSDDFDGMVDGVVSPGAVYPYVRWAVPLATCAAEPLTFGGAGTVSTAYTASDAATADAFGFGFAPGLPPTAICADPCVFGTCTAPGTCTCDPGYEGPTCAVDHDDCAPNPCLNGGTCTDGVDSFTCACVGAWTGTTCEISTGPPQKLNLTGGNFDRNQTYTTPNGTTVVSSAPIWVNSNYYYIAYLFNGTYGTSATHYFLTGSTGNQTLTFNFPQAYTFEYVRVYPTAISDRKSNYLLEAWNGSAWVSVSGGWVVTSSDTVGTYRDHSANLTNITKLRFTLSRLQSWGVTLTEVELYYYP
ncbi:MAG: hypothetical protein EP329_07855 [Deltaproteobacteria bacterium]|nr:MAG: hypothetical protein EP329_07855 [Deltaproteobacteria bacterium]